MKRRCPQPETTRRTQACNPRATPRTRCSKSRPARCPTSQDPTTTRTQHMYNKQLLALVRCRAGWKGATLLAQQQVRVRSRHHQIHRFLSKRRHHRCYPQDKQCPSRANEPRRLKSSQQPHCQQAVLAESKEDSNLRSQTRRARLKRNLR